MTDPELKRRIARSPGEKAGYKQLVRELGLGGGKERRLLTEQLARMVARGELVQLDRDHWGIPRPKEASAKSSHALASSTRENLIAGRLDLHRDGYGFVRPNTGQSGPKEDIFIPPNEINSAMQGDQVLVEVDQGRDGRFQGRIVRVLDRRNLTVVGIFHYARPGRDKESPRGHWVSPFDDRMTQNILIPEGPEGEIALPSAESAWATPHRVLGKRLHQGDDEATLEGMVVDVEITSWPTPTKPPIGRVIEILGYADEFGVDVEMMIRKHQLPRSFPENVLAEARAVAHLDPEEIARRVANGGDFRDRTIVTIDGETARDFDDAVRVTNRHDGGFTLEVHIADVSSYVLPGTALDLEARLRGTSVYFPDRALPMLPHELSSEICSLKPNEDRLVLSCLMNLSSQGQIESYEVTEGVIRSAARMTYTEVSSILDGDEPTRIKYAALVPDFERMHKLAKLMNKLRDQRGSIDFDLPEPVIQFDEHGQMSGVTKAERTWANRLIEEFMLAANECVASWLESLGVPSIYRIHEMPEPRRIVEFEELALSFGYTLGIGSLPVKKFQMHGDKREIKRRHDHGHNKKITARTHEVVEEIIVTPQMYQKLAARIEGKPEERILSYLMLRSLKQARYSEVNEGHFALAAPSYTHFTSPIRRYPDLIVHRIAKALLAEGISGVVDLAEDHPTLQHYLTENFASENQAPIPESELAQIAAETSQTERRAAEAERELMEWKKVRFMQDRVGEEFHALILNPSKYGLFVELTDLFVEGLIPLDSLRDDHYIFREHTHEIIGERNGRVFRAGDRVEVILDRVLIQERRLQFALIEEGIPLTGKRPAPAPKKSKKSKRPAPSKPSSRFYPGNKIAAKPRKKVKAKKHAARKGKRR
jgi:ribonuclease R